MRSDDGLYSGLLPRVPETLSVGDSAHLRMTASGETVELLGTVFLLEGGPGPVPVKDGLVFEVDVTHVTTRPAAEVGPAEALEALAPVEPAGAVEPAPAHADSLEPNLHFLDGEPPPLPRAPEPRSLSIVADAPRGLTEELQSVVDRQRSGWSEEENTQNERSASRRRQSFDGTEPSGVVGTLREMALTEVVQSLGFSGKTAEIALRPKGGVPGVVFLENGHVVYARCGTLEGEDAFFHLAHQRRGAFLVRFHAEAPTKNVQRPTGFLLLEVLRRQDESEHEQKLVNDIAAEQADAVFELSSAVGERTDQRSLPEASAEELDEYALEEHALDEPRLPTPSPFDGDTMQQVARVFDDVPAEEGDVEPTGEAPPADEVDVEYELGDDDDSLLSVEELPTAPAAPAYVPRPRPISLTGLPTTVFSRFFEEASEDSMHPALGAKERDDISDPTFSSLKAALKGLKAGDDDTLAAFAHRHVETSGSYESFG